MDPRAVKQTDLDKKQVYFVLNATKRGGKTRQRHYLKFNHALRGLYRIAQMAEGVVSIKVPGKRYAVKIIARFKKKRGLNTEAITSLDDRPNLKEIGKFWHQVPRKEFNELE